MHVHVHVHVHVFIWALSHGALCIEDAGCCDGTKVKVESDARFN